MRLLRENAGNILGVLLFASLCGWALWASNRGHENFKRLMAECRAGSPEACEKAITDGWGEQRERNLAAAIYARQGRQ